MDIIKILSVVVAQAAAAGMLRSGGLGKHPGQNHPAFADRHPLRPGPKPSDTFDAIFDGVAEAISAFAKAQEDKKVRLTDEQRIDLLLNAQKRYEGPTGFTVGQIVTPRFDSGYNHAGNPHVILEFSDELRFQEDASGGGIFKAGGIYSQHYGHRLDMRVAMITEEGKVAAFWRESWRFEPHPDAPPKAKDDDPDFREVDEIIPGMNKAGEAI